jgi:hypothetical protein
MRDQLPPLLAEIAEVAGLDAALAIAAAKGGQEVFFVSRLTDDNWLVQAVGREKAMLLSDHFTSGRGRIKMNIPLGPIGTYAQARRMAIKRVREALDQGASLNQAAAQAGITARSVSRYKSRLKSPTNHPDLFAAPDRRQGPKSR